MGVIKDFVLPTAEAMKELADKAMSFLTEAALKQFQDDYENMLRTKYGIAKPFADDEGDVTDAK